MTADLDETIKLNEETLRHSAAAIERGNDALKQRDLARAGEERHRKALIIVEAQRDAARKEADDAKRSAAKRCAALGAQVDSLLKRHSSVQTKKTMTTSRDDDEVDDEDDDIDDIDLRASRSSSRSRKRRRDDSYDAKQSHRNGNASNERWDAARKFNPKLPKFRPKSATYDKCAKKWRYRQEGRQRYFATVDELYDCFFKEMQKNDDDDTSVSDDQ